MMDRQSGSGGGPADPEADSAPRVGAVLGWCALRLSLLGRATLWVDDRMTLGKAPCPWNFGT